MGRLCAKAVPATEGLRNADHVLSAICLLFLVRIIPEKPTLFKSDTHFE